MLNIPTLNIKRFKTIKNKFKFRKFKKYLMIILTIKIIKKLRITSIFFT